MCLLAAFGVSYMFYVYKVFFFLVQSPLMLVISVCPFILLLGKSINQSIISPSVVSQQIIDSPSVIFFSQTGSSCRNCHLKYILVASKHKTCVQ